MTARLKVLFVVPTLAAGGAERVVTTLLRHIDRDRFDPTVAVVSLSGAALRNEIPADVPLIPLGGGRVRYGVFHLIGLLFKLRPHVVCSTLDHLNIALAATRMFWPRDIALVCRLTSAYSLKKFGYHFLMRKLLPQADLLIFQSREMEQHYRASGVGGRRAMAIHNPVDIERVRKLAAEPLCTGYDAARFNFVAAGRLVWIKGYDQLIKAIADLPDDVTLTLVGDGPDEAKLQALAKSLGLSGRVRFVGYQENPYPWLSGADAFVMSSHYEGFPNVVLEALTCGVPVAATPVSSIGEIMGDLPLCRIAAGHDVGELGLVLRRMMAQGKVRIAPGFVAPFSAKEVTERYQAALQAAAMARQ